jgi:hypothetical protein
VLGCGGSCRCPGAGVQRLNWWTSSVSDGFGGGGSGRDVEVRSGTALLHQWGFRVSSAFLAKVGTLARHLGMLCN